MRKWVVTLVLIFSCGVGAAPQLSQNKTQKYPVSRQALFERAYKSLGFVLMMAGQDKIFWQWMTSEEKKVYELILPIINEITTLNWLKNQKVEKISKDGVDSYYYVIVNNKPVTIYASSSTHVGLQFSDDLMKFDLKDGKPIRTAITDYSMSGDIFVNLKKINHPEKSITLSEAFSLLLHEFGHKISPQDMGMERSRYQTFIDSLAGKLKYYLDSMVTTTETSGAVVHVLKFRNAPFDPWVEGIVYGHYQGVNIPKKHDPLIAYDRQGTYVLLETSKGVQDLTDTLFDREAAQKHVQVIEDFHYKWGRFNWFLSNHFEILPLQKKGHVSLNFNINQLQMVLPFWQQNSFDPRDYQLYQRAFQSPSHNGTFFNRSVEIDYSSFPARIIQTRSSPLKHDVANYKVEYVEQKWQEQDLILKYKIEGTVKIPYSDINQVNLWPELILEYDGKKFEVRAAKYDFATQLYEFRLLNLKNSNSGVLKIVGLEFSADKINLALPNSDFRVRSFLPTWVEIPLQGERVTRPPILKSIQVGNPGEWKSLRSLKSGEAKKGSMLRFVFEAEEKLRSLTLQQQFDHKMQIYSDVFPGTSQSKTVYGPVYQQTRSASLLFIEAQMNQRLDGKTLYVEIDIDAHIDTQTLDRLPIGLPVPPSSADEPSLIAMENTKSWVDSLRAVEYIQTVTQSLQVSKIQMRQALNFEILPNKSAFDLKEKAKAHTCRDILKSSSEN